MHVTYCRQKQGFFSPAELYMQKFRMAGRLVGVILIVITMREASNMDPYTFFFSFFCIYWVPALQQEETPSEVE